MGRLRGMPPWRLRIGAAVLAAVVVGAVVVVRGLHGAAEYRIEAGSVSGASAVAPAPGGRESSNRVRYRDGTRVRIIWSVRNPASRTIEVERPSSGSTRVARELAVRMGNGRFQGATTPVPFRAFRLERGDQRVFSAQYVLRNCRMLGEPGSGLTLRTQEVTYKVGPYEHTQDVSLISPLRLEYARHCAARR